MAERDIMRLCCRDILVADLPASMRVPVPFVGRHIMAMRHGDLPCRCARTRRMQRRHVAVAAMRMSPDFQSVTLEQDAAGVGDAEHVDARKVENACSLEQALRHYRVMIAGQ